MTVTYKGVPYFVDSSPRATARPQETAYFGETIAPKPTRVERKGQEGEQPEISFGMTARRPTFEPSASLVTMKSVLCTKASVPRHRGYIDQENRGPCGYFRET